MCEGKIPDLKEKCTLQESAKTSPSSKKKRTLSTKNSSTRYASSGMKKNGSKGAEAPIPTVGVCVPPKTPKSWVFFSKAPSIDACVCIAYWPCLPRSVLAWSRWAWEYERLSWGLLWLKRGDSYLDIYPRFGLVLNLYYIDLDIISSGFEEWLPTWPKKMWET